MKKEQIKSRQKITHLLFNNEMADKNKINNICSICLETFKDPIVTSCGHVYCWNCIHEWYSSKVHECPQCRNHISLYDLNIYDRKNSDKYLKYTKPIKVIQPSMIENARSFGGTTLENKISDRPSKRIFFFVIVIFCCAWELYRRLFYDST